MRTRYTNSYPGMSAKWFVALDLVLIAAPPGEPICGLPRSLGKADRRNQHSRLRLRLDEVHPPEKVLKAGVRPDGIPPGKRVQVHHLRDTLFIRFF